MYLLFLHPAPGSRPEHKPHNNTMTLQGTMPVLLEVGRTLVTSNGERYAKAEIATAEHVIVSVIHAGTVTPKWLPVDH